jgi:WD40 repeat protein
LTESGPSLFRRTARTLATGGKGGEVKLWPARQQLKGDALSGISGPLAISPDGQTLIASAGNDAIGTFDIGNGELLKRMELEPTRFRGPTSGISGERGHSRAGAGAQRRQSQDLGYS